MDSANQDQIEFWNRLGQRWVEYQESLDRFWHAPGDAAISWSAQTELIRPYGR